MRLTNNCASSLAFAWFQLPEGLTAEAPVHGATYTTPGGNTYEVRNPQLGPFRSIRFKRIGGDLKNGASDVFEYTLPKQAQPLFILVSVKLADGTVAEAHLNTFACPALPYVGATPPAEDRHPAALATGVRVYPNPTDGLLLVQLHDTSDETAFIAVLNVQGQFVLEGRYAASEGQIALLLPEELPDGLYYLRVQAAGVWTTIRFVLKD